MFPFKMIPCQGTFIHFQGCIIFVFDLPQLVNFGSLSPTFRVLYIFTMTSRVLFHLKNWIHFFPWNVPGWFFFQPQTYMCQFWKFLPKKLTRLDSELPSWQLKHAKLPTAKLGIKTWSSALDIQTFLEKIFGLPNKNYLKHPTSAGMTGCLNLITSCSYGSLPTHFPN